MVVQVLAWTKEQLNKGFPRKLSRGLQSSFSLTILLLITSEAALLTCFEMLGLGRRCSERIEVPLSGALLASTEMGL